MVNNKQKILVSGSLGFDRIMDFPGFFKDHILPNQTHILNVSFVINNVKESFGGTGGNIAYNLALLKQPIKLLGVAGHDFTVYSKWLRQNNINTSKIKVVKNSPSCVAYVMTDKSDNQISSFYPGPLNTSYAKVANSIKNVALAIIAPDYTPRMLACAKIYKRKKLDYIFDPGQQITSFSAAELKSIIKYAKVLIGNDYEIKLISNKIGLSLRQLQDLVDLLVVTKGPKGSDIYYRHKRIKISAVKPKKIIDPTGAGDAYRAGLITGLLADYPLAKVGRLASLIATYAVEKQGTQAHKFSMQEFKQRYKQNFKESL